MTLALIGGERAALPFGKKLSVSTRQGLGGPQDRFAYYGEVKILARNMDSKSDPSTFQQTASRYTACAIEVRTSTPKHIYIYIEREREREKLFFILPGFKLRHPRSTNQ
jgi:hypothetical protein